MNNVTSQQMLNEMTKKEMLNYINQFEKKVINEFEELKKKIDKDYVDMNYREDPKLKIFNRADGEIISTVRVRRDARDIKLKTHPDKPESFRKPLGTFKSVTLAGLLRLHAPELKLFLKNLTAEERTKLWNAVKEQHKKGNFSDHNYTVLRRQIEKVENKVMD